MSQLKRYIVLILAVTLIQSPVWAEVNSQEPPVPSQELFKEIVQKLPEKISGYSLSESQALEMAKAMANAANKNQPIVQFGQKWFTSSLQSFMTAFVLIGAGEVHKRAHERNLQLTPENVKQLSQEVTSDWSLLRQTAYSSADGTLMFIPSQGLNFVAAKTVSRLVTSQVMGNVLKSLIAGTVLSIGLNYVTDMINVSAKYVIDHESQFGGVNATELSILKLLQVRSGISYYFHGLVAGGPETKSAHLKVFKAMQMMLFHDPVLRETLWSHMTREALLKGNNINIVGMSAISTLISNRLMPPNSANIGTLEKWVKSLGISVTVAFISSAIIPNWFEDLETFAMRSTYAHAKFGTHELRPGELAQAMAFGQNAESQRHWTEAYLNKRESARQYCFVMFASILKLALDRMDALEFEKEQAKKMKAEQDAIMARESLGQKIRRAPERAFYNVLGGDLISADSKIKEDDILLTYYRKLFWRAAADISALYSGAAMEMENAAKEAPAAAQGLFFKEFQRMRFLQAFTTYFVQTLTEKWTLNHPQIEFWATRQALDQISFWGWHENEVLATQSPAVSQGPK